MRIILFLTLLYLSVPIHAQDNGIIVGEWKTVFYGSYQHTADRSKDTTKAQFGGNNKLFDIYLTNEVSNYTNLTIDLNTTLEISFKVTKDGSVDSITVNKSSGYFGLDENFENILYNTSGKWIPPRVHGGYSSEWIKVWIHIFQGRLIKKSLSEYIELTELYYGQEKYKNALKSVEAALLYDELNIKAAIYKAKILEQESKKDGCSFISNYSKYKNKDIFEYLSKNCY